MRRFITSDQHFDHAKIIEYSKRPFANVEAMNEGLIERFNAVVGPNDTTIHLGDFALHSGMVKPMLARLNGTHELLPGNHDHCHPCHRKSGRERRRYVEEHGFARVYEGTTLELELDGVGRVLLSHMPFRNAGSDERYPENRITPEQFRGCAALLHGHVHEAWKLRDHPTGRMLNVGVDVWEYTPVSFDQIRQALHGREELSS